MEKNLEPKGSKIPGSIFVRDYCAACNDPIRVSPAALRNKRNFCIDCEDKKVVLLRRTKDRNEAAEDASAGNLFDYIQARADNQ